MSSITSINEVVDAEARVRQRDEAASELVAVCSSSTVAVPAALLAFLMATAADV